MKRLNVADAALRTPPAASPDDVPLWLREMEIWAEGFLRFDADAPGASSLTEARKFIRQCNRALASGDAQRATWAGMRAIDHLWRAQMLDALPMVTSGVTTYRAAENANAESIERSKARYAAWQARAGEIWRLNPRLSKPDMGERLAREFAGNPELSAKASTIRKRLRKP